MKRNILALAMALMLTSLCSCEKAPETSHYPSGGGNTETPSKPGKDENEDDGKKDEKPALPVGQETIRVLFVGNSFTLDATEHLPGILNAAGITNFSMERAYHGGYTLVGYNQNFDNPKVCLRYKLEPGYEKWDGDQSYNTANCNSSLADFWDSGKPYDIVVMQEYTGTRYAWAGFDRHLEGIEAVKGLMEKIRAKQPDKEPIFVYLMSQTFATGSELLQTWWHNDRSRMYAAMTSHVKLLLEQTGIKWLVATGTAVENLRTTSLNIDNGMDLSRDLFHLDKGITRYAANCTVFDTILGPCVGKTMSTNTYRFPTSDTSHTNYTTPVTDSNAPIAQTAALKAIESPLEVTDLSNL